MMGMGESMVNSAIERYMGHIQIHSKLFSEDMHISYNLKNMAHIRKVLNNTDSIAAYSERTIVEGMAQSAASSFGIKIVGINPQDEKKVIKLHEKVVAGGFLELNRKNEILIGRKLATRLNLDVSKKIILTFQDNDGEIIYMACRISGIYKTESSMFDESTVFLKQADLTNAFSQSGPSKTGNIKGKSDDTTIIHEIAILAASSQQINSIKKKLAGQLKALDVKSWEELAPELSYIASSMEIFTYLFVAIILFALLFGITNNMLMSVMERIRELGILTAVGMNKLRIFNMILLETILLSLTGGILGMLIGSFFIGFYNKEGIDLSAFASGLESFGSGTMLYPFLPVTMYISMTIMIIIAANIASLLPAWKATHLQPADAIRTY